MNKDGIWISKEVLNDKNLDWRNKVLLTEIYYLITLKHGCIASNQYFGELLGIKKSAASKRISRLEKMGYITCTDQFDGRLCVGRVITKGSSPMNHTVVPKKRGGSSRKTRGVVPTEQGGSSTGNTINTSINTDLKKQLEIHNTGPSILEKKNEKKSDPSFFFEEAKMEAIHFLTGATILGEEILMYCDGEQQDELLGRIGNIQFDLITPQLQKLNFATKQLDKLKSSSTEGLASMEPT